MSSIADINFKDQSIFVTGETGVGKTLVAKYLHSIIHDNDTNFIHLNCAEIPENLIESELFGHEKGSFTGADKTKKGKLSLADGGTLFLDEIATMSLSMQQKLLKALDEKQFYPIGSSKPVKSNFTLISATCEDLFQKISQNKFRKDLFFRISGLSLNIPALRQRANDLPLLIKHFLKKSSRKVVLSDCAYEALKSYSWPGNIRELSKAILILTQDKNGYITGQRVLELLQNTAMSEEKSSFLTTNQKDFIQDHGLKDFIKRIEQQTVQEALKRNQGKIALTIKELGLSASAFYRIFNTLNA